MPERYRSIVDVHVILFRHGKILLLERQGTGYCDGMPHLPSGHLEEGEPADRAAVREVREETGVEVHPGLLRLVATVHHRQGADLARLGLFFLAEEWSGEPVNAEPHKCGKLLWADPDLLPSTTIPYPAAGIRAWRTGRAFTAHAWPDS
ncbi:NUDIX domain-containing protein [Streptomonospora sp. S1-112]|uniref:NUDIX domain-containing protein n=1 Tax=Streptomonospora mangrovi TaxID=2883123 RepID=A0A9X3NUY9_9ACTN|nr:NUDIX domain-containing protein [Streptomonospora mangrovi]MDA0567365.1 NUDIX domain-containing protein [Streptomonospora mangrovi]